MNIIVIIKLRKKGKTRWPLRNLRKGGKGDKGNSSFPAAPIRMKKTLKTGKLLTVLFKMISCVQDLGLRFDLKLKYSSNISHPIATYELLIYRGPLYRGTHVPDSLNFKTSRFAFWGGGHFAVGTQLFRIFNPFSCHLSPFLTVLCRCFKPISLVRILPSANRALITQLLNQGSLPVVLSYES